MKIFNFCFLFCSTSIVPFSIGQNLRESEKAAVVKLDTAVRIGKLANGFTYYLKKVPADRVVFGLVIKAGFNQEGANKTEMSHLIEHLGLRESKSFPAGIRNYFKGQIGLLRIGARTSTNTTAYRICLRGGNTSLIEDGITAMHDVANGLEIMPSSVGEEISAVVEEGRLRSADLTTESLIKANIFPGLSPIKGQVPKISEFDSSEVSSFYHKWYQPNRTVLVVVGDFDLAGVERKIVRCFSGLRNTSKDPLPCMKGEASFKGGITTISEENKKNVDIRIYYDDAWERASLINSIQSQTVRQMYNELVHRRLQKQLENNPLLKSTHSNFTLVARDRELLSVGFSADKTSSIKPTFFASMEEMERIKRYGFNKDEVEDARKVVLADLDNFRLPTAEELADKYEAHAIDGIPLFDEESKNNYQRKQLKGMSDKQINEIIKRWLAGRRRAIFVVRGDSNKYNGFPGSDSISSWSTEIEQSNLRQFHYVSQQRKAILSPIIVSRLKGGKYTIEKDQSLEMYHLVLANHIEIYFKPVGCKQKCDIQLEGFRRGGYSRYSDGNALIARSSALLIRNSSFTDLSPDDLRATMSTNFLTPYVDERFEGFRGHAENEAELEKVLQLLYKFSVYPHVSSKAVEDWKDGHKRKLDDENTSISKAQEQLLRSGAESILSMTSDENVITQDRVLKIYNQIFSNAYGFSFFISGSFEMEKVISIINKYVGSLPTKIVSVRDVPVKSQLEASVSEQDAIFVAPEKSDQANVGLSYSGNYLFNTRNNIALNILNGRLGYNLITRLREKERGVYFVNSGLGVSGDSGGFFNFTVRFPCGPQNVDRLIAATKDVVLNLQQFDTPEGFELCKEKERKKMDDNSADPQFWVKYMVDQYKYQRDFHEILEQRKSLEAMTAEEVSRICIEIFRQGSFRTVVVLPKP